VRPWSAERPGCTRDQGAGWLHDVEKMLRDLSRRDGVIVDVERFRMYRDWQGHGYEVCWWSSLSSVISPSGEVWVCCNSRGYPDHKLGNVHEKSFDEIWERAPLPWKVTDRCRLMCRGHVVNLCANEILVVPVGHENFI
jgi:MoaA/NifB/PqqE/SkfB family radical SAM enzyme